MKYNVLNGRYLLFTVFSDKKCPFYLSLISKNNLKDNESESFWDADFFKRLAKALGWSLQKCVLFKYLIIVKSDLNFLDDFPDYVNIIKQSLNSK